VQSELYGGVIPGFVVVLVGAFNGVIDGRFSSGPSEGFSNFDRLFLYGYMVS
jgi:hypothetical protein